MNTFSIGEAVKFGWNTTKSNIGFLVVMLFLILFINTTVPVLLNKVINSLFTTQESNPTLLPLLLTISIIVIFGALRMIMDLGQIKISLKFNDNQKPQFGDIFSSAHLLLKYFIANILYNLIIFAGFLLLIIPGIIWTIKFGYYSYFIIDKELGPIEALKQSSRITQGVKLKLLLFHLTLTGIIILGFLALGIGLLWAIPTNAIASAFVYRKLSSQTLNQPLTQPAV